MSCWETQLFEPLGDAFFFSPPPLMMTSTHLEVVEIYGYVSYILTMNVTRLQLTWARSYGEYIRMIDNTHMRVIYFQESVLERMCNPVPIAQNG